MERFERSLVNRVIRVSTIGPIDLVQFPPISKDLEGMLLLCNKLMCRTPQGKTYRQLEIKVN